jgi:hypothetical protein
MALRHFLWVMASTPVLFPDFTNGTMLSSYPLPSFALEGYLSELQNLVYKIKKLKKCSWFLMPYLCAHSAVIHMFHFESNCNIDYIFYNRYGETLTWQTDPFTVDPHLKFALGLGCLNLKSGTFLHGDYMKIEEEVVPQCPHKISALF